MRAVVAVLGVLAVAWLSLSLSAYGVLVRTGHTIAGPMGDIITASVLRCTYFTGTEFRTEYHDPVTQPVCPRLRSFGQ